MSSSAPSSPRTAILAALSGLVIGVPAGYMATAIVGRPSPVQSPMRHDAMTGMASGHGDSEATMAFRRASARMHADMGADYSGDVDLDFVRGMVPHHQGAVDMARIELEHGTDPVMRDLARRVVDTQQAEIAVMRQWMASRPGER